jgi:hypothetical protein
MSALILEPDAAADGGRDTGISEFIDSQRGPGG